MQYESEANTALFQAAKNGNVTGLRDALEKGANPDFFTTNEEGNPASIHASIKFADEDSSLECVKILLESGANVNTKLISNQNSALHEAASVGSEDVCKELIKAGSTVDAGNSFGNSPLQHACRSRSVEIVRLLLEQGIDVNAQNNRGSTALHICAYVATQTNITSDEDRTNIGRLLSFYKGEGKRRRRESSLVIDPALQIAAILLKCGHAKVDVKDKHGYTALHIASERGCTHMVQLLVDSGASLTIKTNLDSKGRGGRSAVEMAKFGSQHQCTLLLQEMEQIDPALIVTRSLANDLESGYPISEPYAGSGVAVAKKKFNK